MPPAEKTHDAVSVATFWMQRGHAAEARGGAEGAAEALSSYASAVAVLESAPGRGSKVIDRALGIARMNRGNARRRHADEASLRAAIVDYEAAIALLEAIAPGDAALHNSIGAAWMNRGQCLHRLGPALLSESAASQRTAIAWLASLPRGENPAVICNLTGAHINLANVLLDLGGDQSIIEARDVARTALDVIAPLEKQALIGADLGLRARRALCDALGQMLALRNRTRPEQEQIADELGEVVEDALVLHRACEPLPGSAALSESAIRLFCIGARLYALHQPHFLVEFLFEELDRPSSSDRTPYFAVADEALILAETRLADSGIVFDTDDSQRALETLDDLRSARKRLSRTHTPPPASTS